MAKTLPISEVKTRLPELVTGVEEREEEVVVTRKGKPAAVLVNYSEYERLKQTLDVLADPALMRQIRRSRKFYSQGAGGYLLRRTLPSRSSPRKSANGNGRLPARHPTPCRSGYPPSCPGLKA